jgi:hypothetical protein
MFTIRFIGAVVGALLALATEANCTYSVGDKIAALPQLGAVRRAVQQSFFTGPLFPYFVLFPHHEGPAVFPWPDPAQQRAPSSPPPWEKPYVLPASWDGVK